MDIAQWVQSFILGLIEGVTEFIPVSSTGHLVLAGHFMGFHSTNNTFEILIQLGAILAILTVYCAKLMRIIKALPFDPSARRFVIGVLLAFLPAVIIGILAHGFIKSVLLDSPKLICISLIIGGIILIIVDCLPIKPRYTDATHYPLSVYFKIGLCQCVAMIPGVSRSGSTIVGALLMGADKRSAAEFSFFLAMPTMVGAFAYDLMKNYKVLTWNDGVSIFIGFFVAFIAGVFVVRRLLDYVSNHGYRLFGYWRLIVGILGLLALTFWG
ncbi:undecaprenyl-diphosphate phosphatase [Bartonella tamiae]|uniref:Undecaprenyl-diphosphatase n=1 Tax=Bartonella tamiae Th239 TaxID=1094558 RepID=J1JZ32_9HYPH|nr:undecaprenyl-diphosphate phosphatase [Bartonella tamiae]EJF90377.1 undecaprenyl-diphosphatase UppP [Bartonella tamiae Th239]EJF93679.1 undecaprenyl-diphosphatase UppP [Bartonella tamiae Th307]